jgi:hypothetical protein
MKHGGHMNHDIVSQAKALLARGPLTESELLQQLNLQDSDPLLDDDSGIWFTLDGKLAIEEPLFEGLTLTHVLSEHNVATGILQFDVDLAAGQVEEQPLPPGAAVGDVVAVTWSNGGYSASVIDRSSLQDGEREAEALRDTFVQSLGRRSSCQIENLIPDIRVSNRDLFAQAVPPVSELLATVGMTHDDTTVGIAGEPWDEWTNELGRHRLQRLAVDMEFEDHCEAAFRDVIDEWAKPEPDATRVAHQLEHSNVSLALTNWSFDPVTNRPWLRRFANSIPDRHPLTPLRSYFLGSLAAFELDLETADQLLSEALESRVESVAGAAADTAGRIASIRGDARRAHDLLRKAGIRDAEVEFLTSIVAARTGRNEPCACGSGKKFKHCHQGSMELTPPQRMKWIVVRIGHDLAEDDTYAIQRAITDALGDLSLPEIEAISEDALTIDIVFFEGGFAQDFLDRYRKDMKDDDRDLLERMLAAPRQVLRITNSSPLHVDVNGKNQRAFVLEASETPIVGNFLLGRFVEIDNILVSAGLVMELEPESAREFEEFLQENPRPDANNLLQWLFAPE